MENISCEQLKKEYEDIKSLKQEFDLAYRKAVETGELEEARELKNRIESQMNSLREKLWPFESLPQKEFQEQYESQKEIFIKTGILEKLSTGEMGLPRSSPEAMVWGIKGIDNQEYAFPKMEEVSKMMRENKEILKTKTEQGFNRLLIVPFGMKLDDLIEKYKQVILKHHKEGKLLATKKDPKEPDQKLELDENQPVWVWDKYLNADVNGELIYQPKEFSKNHQGKTKKEILKEAPSTGSGQGGWNILLIEDLPNIPREGKGEIIGKRPQIDTSGTSIKKYIKKGEAIPSPSEYLKAIQTESIYQNETGMTPEDQITYAITHLEQTNQAIDDWRGNGSISYQLGAYFPASGGVPGADWDRGSRGAYVGRDVPGDRGDDCGVRGSVRVSKS